MGTFIILTHYFKIFLSLFLQLRNYSFYGLIIVLCLCFLKGHIARKQRIQNIHLIQFDVRTLWRHSQNSGRKNMFDRK